MSRTINIIRQSDESFLCIHCGLAVSPLESGGRNRNHCPHCLSSRHMDLRPGDRRSACRGLMKAIGLWVQPKGEWSLIHRCETCATIRVNRIAGDDNETALLEMALKPVQNLPFPSDLKVSGGVQ